VFKHTESSLYKALASPNTTVNNFLVTLTSIFITAAVNAGDVILLMLINVEEDVGSASSTGGTYVEVITEPGTRVLLRI
jgi:hypothetical protein